MATTAAVNLFRRDVKTAIDQLSDAIEAPEIGTRIVGLRNFREVSQILFAAGLSPQEASALLIGVVMGKRATEAGQRLLGVSLGRL
jgi:hypothetical protein